MSDTLNASLLHLLHRASQVADDSFSGHSQTGDLTARQYVVLTAIASREGSSQTAIAEMTGIDRSTLADVVGRLQRRGFVARKRTRQDARAYAVRMTDSGQRLLAIARPIAELVDSQLFSAIAPQKRAEFVKHLRLIADGATASGSAGKQGPL